MYRQFDSSDKPKSAARLLAEAAFAPPSASRHAADNAAPVVKIVNRRFTLQSRSYRLVGNDGQPGQTPAPATPVNLPEAQQQAQHDQAGQAALVMAAQPAPVAAKTARVFLLPALATDTGVPVEPIQPAHSPAAVPLSVVGSTSSGSPLLSPPALPADAPTVSFADSANTPAASQHRDSRLLRKSRRTSPHGPVRVIYSAPPALCPAPQADGPMDGAAANAEASPSGQQQLESILFLQQQMDEVDALLADIQFAENFDIGLESAVNAAELKNMLAELDRLAEQFPGAGGVAVS